jgi:transcriptional regulator with XRE-family HTH domain
MPPRKNPTLRQTRLGTELRKLREAAGMSTREAGELLGGNSAQISHIESGRWGVSAERVRRLAALYSASEGELIDALCAMAGERGKGWWEEYRGILPPPFLHIAELEYHASRLRYVQALTVPGILQTEDYARSLFRQVIPPLPRKEIAARVEHRLRRGMVLEGETPKTCEAFIHEAALRMRYGGRRVTRGQLGHLLAAVEWPSVTIRVIPFAADGFSGSAQAVLYACGAIPQLDTIQVDGSYGGAFLDAAAQLAKYRAIYRTLEGIALDVPESREMIRRVAEEL